MHSEVEGLTHPLSQPFKSDLEGRLRQIQENLTFLKDQPEEILTYHLKPLSDQIVDVYQLVCILKEAEDQAGTDGNGRKFIIAELYRQAHFQSTASDRIRQTRLPDLIHFDDWWTIERWMWQSSSK